MVNELITDQHTLITFYTLHFDRNKKVNRTRTFRVLARSSSSRLSSQIISMSDDTE